MIRFEKKPEDAPALDAKPARTPPPAPVPEVAEAEPFNPLAKPAKRQKKGTKPSKAAPASLFEESAKD